MAQIGHGMFCAAAQTLRLRCNLDVFDFCLWHHVLLVYMVKDEPRKRTKFSYRILPFLMRPARVW